MATSENNPHIHQIQKDVIFSEAAIASFVKTKQDFIDGKTTARNWKKVKEDLELKYGK